MTKARRPNLYLVMALRRRYGQAKGAGNASDVEHLGAVILMFEPGADLAAIAPIRLYKPHRERWSRTALHILRTANAPMRARELARRVMAEHGGPILAGSGEHPSEPPSPDPLLFRPLLGKKTK